jgi:hypothetical protein
MEGLEHLICRNTLYVSVPYGVDLQIFARKLRRDVIHSELSLYFLNMLSLLTFIICGPRSCVTATVRWPPARRPRVTMTSRCHALTEARDPITLSCRWLRWAGIEPFHLNGSKNTSRPNRDFNVRKHKETGLIRTQTESAVRMLWRSSLRTNAPIVNRVESSPFHHLT